MPKAKTQSKKKVAKKTAASKVKKVVKKTAKPKKIAKKVVVKKRVVKKTTTKKKIVKKPAVKKAIKKRVIKSNLPKNEEKNPSASFVVEKNDTSNRDQENKKLFSPDIFGTSQVGSPYFNTIRRQIEIQRLVQKQNHNNSSEEFGNLKNSFVESFKEREKSEELKKEKVIFVKKENDISIDFDLKIFDGSPHVVDLQNKNTHQIKELISGKAEKYKLPSQYVGAKAKTKIKPIKIKKELRIKPNLINEELIWEKRKQSEKIGFWKTLIMPIYTIFYWAENLFVDLSRLSKGSLPRAFRFSLPDKWYKSLATFVILCLMFVLPFESVFIYSATDKKGIVLGEATTAIDSLKSGGSAVLGNDLIKANYHFLESLDNFKKANQELADINSFVINLLEKTNLDGGRVSSGKNLVNFGESVSRSAVYLNAALVSLAHVDEKSEMSPVKVNETTIEGVNLPGDILSKIASVKGNILSASQELRIASNNSKNVNLNILEDSDTDKIVKINELFPVLISSLDNFYELLQGLEIILGKDQFKRYLLIFQNNYELRATGGFIGSFALMDVDNGVIKSVEMPGGGSYDLQGGLNRRISSPEPLYLISPLWQFHDANWWPDFPTSAQKLMHFYEISGGRTVDGVIAMTPQIIIDLLKITGPIEMEEYDEVVNADNFMWVTQYNVELEYDKEENKPKKFLSDLCIKLLSRVTDKDILAENGGLLGFIDILNSAAKKKDLQLYFDDSSVQNIVKKYSLDGGIKNSEGDYLMVVNTSVGGGKSDSVIQQTIDLESKVGKDGAIFNKLTIKRKHNGNRDDFFQRVRNVNWLRVYVPEGAELIATRGFERPGGESFRKPEGDLEVDKDINNLEGGYLVDKDSGTRIYDQFGKTVFANWSMVDLGEEAIIEIEYKLPFDLLKKEIVPEENNFVDKIVSSFIQEEDIPLRDLRSHTLLVQKQSGINSNFNYKLVVPYNWKTEWVKSPTDSMQDILTYDKFFGKIFEIKYPTLPNL